MKKIYIPLSILFYCSSSISLSAQKYVMYGLASSGGSTNMGTIFEFNPVKDSEKGLFNFDGKISAGSTLVYDSVQAVFYGTCSTCGTNTEGAVYSFNPNTSATSNTWDFGIGTDGFYPYSSMIYDPSAKLFLGTTPDGGKNNDGAIYNYNPVSNLEKILYSFRYAITADTDGEFPYGALVLCPTNQLYYGLTSNGGNARMGTIFSFNAVTDSETKVWNFGHGKDGTLPNGTMLYDNATQLFYGFTSYGGTNNVGVIFSFNPATNKENVVWSFGSGSDGNSPNNYLLEGPGGILYGTTQQGGTHGLGAIISYNTGTNTEKVVWNFGATGDGSSPYNNNLLYDAANGLFYGLTPNGGNSNAGKGNGVIYSFDPTTDKEKVLWIFGNSTKDGTFPKSDLAWFPGAPESVASIENKNAEIKVYPNPFNSFTNIVINSYGKHYLEVEDITGRKLQSIEFSGNQYQLSSTGLSAGLYFIRIYDAGKSVISTAKVVVQ